VAVSGLLDTNVLVYAVYPSSPHFADSRALIDLATVASPLYVNQQVLAEFYSVVTDARRVSQPRTPDEAIHAIEQFLALPGIVLLPVPADLITR
jgi:predicted nucleic acid-binding protein